MSNAALPESKPVWRGRFRLVLGWMFGGTLVLFGLSFLGRWLLVAELVTNFQVQILACLCLAAVGSRWLRFNRLSLYLFLAALVTVGRVGWVSVPEKQLEAGSERLRVMTFNVLGSNQQFDAVAREIVRQKPDVVAILEYTQHWEQALQSLHQQFPYRVEEPRWHGFGIAVFSRIPIASHEVVNYTSELADLPMIRADLLVGRQTLSLYAVHLVSPLDTNRLRVRNRQLEKLGREIESQDSEHTVVVGDFNCTTWSSYLRKFLRSSRLRDSRRSMFAIQASWDPGTWLLRIPIDHVFVGEKLVVENRELGEPSGSDHHPVIAEIAIGRDESQKPVQ